MLFINYCQSICCSKAGTPEQIHLSLTGSNSEMAVVWLSTEYGSPQVKFGVNKNSLVNVVNANSYTYNTAGFLGVIHRGIMKGLAADTTYFYQVGDVNNGWSTMNSFKTYAAKPRPTKILSIGDLGSEPIAFNTQNRIVEYADAGTIDMVVHAGDVAYSDGVEQIWDYYFRKSENWAARVPYMASPGNHELMFNFTAFRNRFYFPFESSNAENNLYYSFNHGYAHWIFGNADGDLLTELSFPVVSTAFKNWLQADLAKANNNRKNTPWIIVVMHRPLYCSQTEEDTQFDCTLGCDYLKKHLEDIFYNYNVDLILYGHRHSYERFYPVYKGIPEKNYNNPRAPVQIINGAAGNREDLESPYSDPPSAWTVYRNNKDYGYSIINIYNETNLDMTYYSSANKQELDYFRLYKKRM